jgi:hypothetical protein
MKKKAILLMLALMFVSTNALSQNTIYGTVSGDIQTGVTVRIYIVDCGTIDPVAELTTGVHGNYAYGGLENGRYLVTADYHGYSFVPVSGWIDIPQEPIQPLDFTAVETPHSFMYDMPIAICEEAVTDSSGGYNCNIGRVFNDNTDMARWTNFEQWPNGTCPGGPPSSADIRPLITCVAGGVNPDPISLGSGLATTNGIIPPVSKQVHDCFTANEPPQILESTLPVVDCGESPSCGVVIGAVNVDIIWITYGTDPAFYDAPTELWSADGEQLLWQYADNGTNGEVRWADFVDHFNLQEVYGGAALYKNMSIYFKPSCN